MLEEASYSLAQTIKTLTSERMASELGFGGVYDGVLLLVDEADNASPELHLGSFFKLLIERVQRSGCDRLCIGLAGLPKVVEVLTTSHASSLRLFEELPLGPLSAGDTARVVGVGLKIANAKNDRETTIADDAQELLAHLAEGLPHFIQQFAASAFARDTDWEISMDDVLDSAFGPGGAYDLIGNRYYRDAFYNQIRQDSYRQVLRIMADETSSQWVKKSLLRRKFKGKDSTLDNAIHALSERGLIVREPGALGSYRLLHRGFARWIKFYTLEPDAARQLVLEEEAKSSEGIGWRGRLEVTPRRRPSGKNLVDGGLALGPSAIAARAAATSSGLARLPVRARNISRNASRGGRPPLADFGNRTMPRAGFFLFIQDSRLRLLRLSNAVL